MIILSMAIFDFSLIELNLFTHRFCFYRFLLLKQKIKLDLFHIVNHHSVTLICIFYIYLSICEIDIGERINVNKNVTEK